MRHEDKVFLIVDDEPHMCWALEHVLKKNGFLSKKALSGREALTLVKQQHFELAFLDAKLPDIEGLELAAQIRKVDPSLGIVMISGYFYKDDPEVRRAVAEGLIHGFISKPFNHSEILKVINATPTLPFKGEGVRNSFH